MRLVLGCDEAACELKERIRQHLLAQGHAAEDHGTHDGKSIDTLAADAARPRQ